MQAVIALLGLLQASMHIVESEIKYLGFSILKHQSRAQDDLYMWIGEGQYRLDTCGWSRFHSLYVEV